MPSYIVRPNGEGGVGSKSDWTEPGTSYDKTDDVVTQPTAPGAGDLVTTTIAGKTDRLEYETFTLPYGEIVNALTYWCYVEANVASNGINWAWYLGNYSGGGDRGAGANLFLPAGTGWQSMTITRPFVGAQGSQDFTQADLDAMNFQRDSGPDASAGARTVRAEYVEYQTIFVVDTTALPAGIWDARLKDKTWF